MSREIRPHRHQPSPGERLVQLCRRDPERWVTEPEAEREFGIRDLETVLEQLRSEGYRVESRGLRTITGAMVPQWRVK